MNQSWPYNKQYVLIKLHDGTEAAGRFFIRSERFTPPQPGFELADGRAIELGRVRRWDPISLWSWVEAKGKK